ncbi:hypothetical protein [Reichenbachiella sp. MALMAid0571]|uniref:hypothetical protein n=1 Tax=Reichenbachiella sp. MALMAid0571 TaxID=3143939 RepID=UPI0032DFB5E1
MKVFKYFILPLVILTGTVFLVYKIVDEPLPEGNSGEEADLLAKKMLESISDDAWQNTGAVQWEFSSRKGINKHLWDRKRHFAQVEFEGNLVQIDINNRRGVVLNNSHSLSELRKAELCEKAWRLWINDSFWLNPVSKVFDPGVSRKIVKLEGTKQALLVTYESGGVTPGDSYLWILDNNFRPQAWKFWVSIIPVGGLEFSWEGWEQLQTGAYISTIHKGVIDISVNNVAGRGTLNELTGGKDIFSGFQRATVQF